MDLRPSDTVFGETENDEYTIIRILGSGQFGVVYEAQDSNGISLALKTIITASADTTTLQSFINEGRLATEIQHENVVRYFFFHDGRQYPQFPPYILMEYADGGTLEDLLGEHKSHNEYFEANELRALLLQLASGMKAINEKLVHRDIKPDNILLAHDVLKISDFGLSKIVGAATRSRTFKGINHIKYCAPEAWRLEENAPAMDVYSMGIVFYEVATLEYPYPAKQKGDIIESFKNVHLFEPPTDPRSHNPGLGIALAQTILKMLSKRPDQRYSSWGQVIQRLQSPRSSSQSTRNVGSLVERALERHKQAEDARLRAQEEANKRREYEESVVYCFKEIVAATREIVDAFNDASEFVKLSLYENASLSFLVYVEGRDSPIKAEVTTVYGEHELEGQPIKAWGYIKAPSGRGFNLLLVAADPDDLYGQWKALFASHNALSGRRDSRPEPFPFEMRELPREMQILRAMHAYSTSVRAFKPEMLNPLIEEILYWTLDK